MAFLWTRGESNPFPLHAMEVYYRYTTGPVSGPDRSRTGDLRNANAAHYQLCYRPIRTELQLLPNDREFSNYTSIAALLEESRWIDGCPVSSGLEVEMRPGRSPR